MSDLTPMEKEGWTPVERGTPLPNEVVLTWHPLDSRPVWLRCFGNGWVDAQRLPVFRTITHWRRRP